MFRNYLMAAWRSARRDRLHAVINILGLALGLSSAILIGLYVRDELSFERFVTDYQDVYRLQLTLFDTGRAPQTNESSSILMAEEMRLDFPEVVATTRFTDQDVGLRHGDVEAREKIRAADGSLFAVVSLPLLSGDPATALAAPDQVVLSKAMALKYFGTTACLGQSMEIDRTHPVLVTGVLADPPGESEEEWSVILSAKSAYSSIARTEALPKPSPGSLITSVDTWLRLKPGTDVSAFRDRLDRFVLAHYPQPAGDTSVAFRLWLKPIAETHLNWGNPDTKDGQEAIAALWAIGITGIMIIIVAGINFVNLVTARASRRAVEVGVRKALGATQRQLIVQFMGESVGYALIGLVCGVALVELLLPSLNAFLDRRISFAYWRDPVLMLTLPAVALLLGLAAGTYPALVLSSFRPAISLKQKTNSVGSGRLRLVLVVAQFAVSIILLIATLVITRQTDYATRDSLTFDQDQVVAIELGGLPRISTGDGYREQDGASVETFKQRVLALPGVRAAASSYSVADAHSFSSSDVKRGDQPDDKAIAMSFTPIDYGYLDVYGMKLLAGRDLDRAYAGDGVLLNDHKTEGNALINMAAVTALGFDSPQAALGARLVTVDPDGGPQPSRIIVGVVPDVQLRTVRQKINPTMLAIDPGWWEYLNVKLKGENVEATLAAIDAIWTEMVPTRPILRSFVNQRIEHMYRGIRRQGAIFSTFAGIAVAIGCLGLFGLAAFTAERRTKEIGIRKALGASTGDVLRLLVWQFAQPVLLANAIAWPIAWVIMRHWLDGFAYRIALGPVPFLIAGISALGIAVATTALHAGAVARARPVSALRYE